MNNIIIIIVILTIALVIYQNKIENFDLTVNLRQYPRIGKFDDLYQIGTRNMTDLDQCKYLCNKMESCKGISYRGSPSYECRTYNDTYNLYYDPRYISWKKFGSRIY